MYSHDTEHSIQTLLQVHCSWSCTCINTYQVPDKHFVHHLIRAGYNHTEFWTKSVIRTCRKNYFFSFTFLTPLWSWHYHLCQGHINLYRILKLHHHTVWQIMLKWCPRKSQDDRLTDGQTLHYTNYFFMRSHKTSINSWKWEKENNRA